MERNVTTQMTECSTSNNAREIDPKTRLSCLFMESEERGQLKELFRERLIESGWTEGIRAHCKEIINRKKIQNVSLEDIVGEIKHSSIASVPQGSVSQVASRVCAFIDQKIENEKADASCWPNM
uniref:Enhancer of yellow 2 transcription factor homolog p n=1 Tax=Albugo laibachii Nc14 TaxID=890382 RepID=F0WL36_9STRA|nr:enhancer of yellow 2 transcription factor homolog p [Albugo laibachii Nc14]|eukprot:CCA21996.1 enhancer of yellow 2 transcription factor homolog p [Albugo laibachii Nc14]